MHNTMSVRKKYAIVLNTQFSLYKMKAYEKNLLLQTDNKCILKLKCEIFFYHVL